MTQQSFDNYRANLLYYQANLGHSLASKLLIGSCNQKQLEEDLTIVTAYIDILNCYEFYPNVLTIIPVGSGVFLNVILGSYTMTVPISSFTITPQIGDTVTAICSSCKIPVDELAVGTVITHITTGLLNYVITLSTPFLDSVVVAWTVTRTSTSDSPNCMTREEVLPMIDHLNKIFFTNYCIDLIKE